MAVTVHIDQNDQDVFRAELLKNTSTSAEERVIFLDVDIDITKAWAPVLCHNVTLHGQGHSVGTEFARLTDCIFGNAANGVVNNIHVDNLSVYLNIVGPPGYTAPDSSTSLPRGGFASNGKSCTFSNCISKGMINWKAQRVAGIAGYASACVFRGCENRATIYGFYGCGGIVGLAETKTIVQECTNQGVIYGDDPSQVNNDCGGVVGRITSGDILDSFNYGDISLVTSSGKITGHSGGIVGHLDGSAGLVRVMGCINEADLIGGYIIGGIVGDATYTGSSVPGRPLISENRARCNLDAVGMVVGGVVGQIDGYVVVSNNRNCGNHVASVAEKPTEASSTAKYIGGIVGYVNKATSTTITTEISNNLAGLTHVSGDTQVHRILGYSANEVGTRVILTNNMSSPELLLTGTNGSTSYNNVTVGTGDPDYGLAKLNGANPTCPDGTFTDCYECMEDPGCKKSTS